MEVKARQQQNQLHQQQLLQNLGEMRRKKSVDAQIRKEEYKYADPPLKLDAFQLEASTHYLFETCI
jgi:hypothetical protein